MSSDPEPSSLQRRVEELSPWQYWYEIAPGVRTPHPRNKEHHDWNMSRRKMIFGALDSLLRLLHLFFQRRDGGFGGDHLALQLCHRVRGQRAGGCAVGGAVGAHQPRPVAGDDAAAVVSDRDGGGEVGHRRQRAELAAVSVPEARHPVAAATDQAPVGSVVEAQHAAV